jgi:hypothetical protein
MAFLNVVSVSKRTANNVFYFVKSVKVSIARNALYAQTAKTLPAPIAETIVSSVLLKRMRNIAIIVQRLVHIAISQLVKTALNNA